MTKKIWKILKKEWKRSFDSSSLKDHNFVYFQLSNCHSTIVVLLEGVGILSAKNFYSAKPQGFTCKIAGVFTVII